MSETFYELLISNVKTSRILWDMKHKHYHNRLIVDREWARIAADLQEEKQTVKTKWKNLRDRFKKELKKIPKCRSGDDGENASRYNGTWCHFKSMLFLRSMVTPNLTEGNIEDYDSSSHATPLFVDYETERDITSQSSEAQSNVELDNVVQSQPGTSCSLPKQVKCVPRKQQNDDLGKSLPGKDSPKSPVVIQRKRKAAALEENLDAEFLRLEAKKVALLEKNDDDDEDINFFKSLLPHVRQLPSLYKLSLRSQVQNLLANEIVKVQNNQHAFNSNNSNSASFQRSKFCSKNFKQLRRTNHTSRD